jgi:DNA-binding transcriptional MerR regulator
MAHRIDAPANRLLKIGQLAAQTGLTIRNLRFYADAGVFGELPRSIKGYRLFPPEAVHWVGMLRAAQAAGFSLDEIQVLLKTLRQDKVPCGHVREALGSKLSALEAKLAEIQQLVAVLRVTLGTPDGQSSVVGCDLMGALLSEASHLPLLAKP